MEQEKHALLAGEMKSPVQKTSRSETEEKRMHMQQLLARRLFCSQKVAG